MGVGVLHDRRHAPSGGRGDAGWEVLAVGRAGVHQVDVGVDHARQNEQPAGFDRLPGTGPGALGDDAGDPSVPDQHVGQGGAGTRDHRAAHDREVCLHRSLPRTPAGHWLYFMYERVDQEET